MSQLDQEHLKTWIGKTERLTDVITPVPARALAALLDHERAPEREGDVLPSVWHWVYFLPVHRQSQVGPDGHPKRGGFLPPVTLPRRMWAGSQLQFHQPLHIGEAVTRVSRIDSINFKEGRSGALVFVRVVHEISGAKGLAITEAQDLVYRDHPKPGEPVPPASAWPPVDAASGWTREVVPDPVLLFRYSALTFNGHRIHYDRPYAMDVEGYPGLVVHGPLTATLLLDHLQARYPQAQLTSYQFRGMKPIIDDAPFTLCGQLSEDGRTIGLWARNTEGALCMEAKATVAKELS